MNVISKLCLTVFEILNELYIAMGSGLVGMAVLMNHGYKTNHFIRTLSVISISLGSLVYVFQTKPEKMTISQKKVVFLTGCDSGLGFSLALHLSDLGFTVIGSFLSLESKGAIEIQNMNRQNFKQIQMDVTKHDNVFVAVETVKKYLEANPGFELHAVVNNAGIMVFAEFEWQTENLIQQQIQVNLLGTMELTKNFIPLLRKYKGRLINIISHCSYACLPGLAVYGATKAGLKAFSDGLRVELAKYGVKVIQFTPGSFFTQSNIMAKHPEHVHEMHRSFTDEQHAFYKDYYQRYNAHLLSLTIPKAPQKLNEQKLYDEFEKALLFETPKAAYKVEPIRYALYHLIFKLSPVVVRDYFVGKFMSMPEYYRTESSVKENWRV